MSGRTQWAESASRLRRNDCKAERRLAHDGVCVRVYALVCGGVYVCTMYFCLWVCALEWFRVAAVDGRV